MDKIAVYEVGLISRAGLPVVHLDFRPGITGDPLMTAGFLTALQQFVKSAFADETQSFSMKKFAIYFNRTELFNGEECSIYVITDRKASNHKVIQDRINVIVGRIKNTFTTLDDPDIGNSSAAKDFIEYLRKEFEDLKLRPAERARKLFG